MHANSVLSSLVTCTAAAVQHRAGQRARRLHTCKAAGARPAALPPSCSLSCGAAPGAWSASQGVARQFCGRRGDKLRVRAGESEPAVADTQEALRAYFAELGLSNWNAKNAAAECIAAEPTATPVREIMSRVYVTLHCLSTTKESLSNSLEVLKNMLPGNDVVKMVNSEPAILLANPDAVGNVMTALSELVGTDYALWMVEKHAPLLSVQNMKKNIEVTLSQMAKWAPNTDNEYRVQQLVIYPQLLYRVPKYYATSDWNDIPVEVQNMCSKSCCG